MATINKIIPFSCVDGLGNRMVIFFQGCNFKCTYCHNPETINKCINCGICVSKCGADALYMKDGNVIWDKEECINCDKCIKICPHLASPKVEEYTVDELFKEVEKVKFFIEGITVSGGECSLNAKFLIELFERVKTLGLTCYVDTNGSYDFLKDNILINKTDKFMLDVKSIDSNEHMRITGQPNNIVLKNLKELLNEDKLYEVRTVIAPNINNRETVDKVSKIIKDKCRYKLIKYREFGVREEGIKIHGNEILKDEEIEELKKISIKNGCINTIIT